MLALLLPPGIDDGSALLLILVSIATSALTAAFGIGGGVTLLAAMAPIVPVAALVPVHAVVQLGSNAGRSVILRRHVDGRMLAVFGAGAILGVTVGGLLVTDLPEGAITLAIGVFVLWSAWGRLPTLGGGHAMVGMGGAVSSVLTMFVGATGPFVIALFRQREFERHALVATTAAAMTLQHGLKIVAFGLLGFAFAPWLPLVAAMILSGILGTLIGTRLLTRMPERRFRSGLRLVLIAIGLELLVRGVRTLLA